MKHCLKMMQKISLIAACTALLLPSAGYAVPPQKPFFAQDQSGNPILGPDGIPVPHVEVPQDPKKVALALGAAGLTTLAYASLNAGSSAFMDLLYHKLSSAKEHILGANPKAYYVNWTEQVKKIPGNELTESQKSVLEELLEKMENPAQQHAVITGAAGVGKSSLAWSLAEAISNNDTTIRGTVFEGAQLWRVNAHKLNSTGIVGALAARLQAVLDAANKHWRITGERVILFFDEFHQLVQLGNHKDNQTENVIEILKTLTGNEANFSGYHILGATTQQEFDQFIQKGGPAARRFYNMPLPEPDDNTTRLILKKTAFLIQKKGRVLIRPSELDAICRGCVTAARRGEGANPDKAKKLLHDLVGTFGRYHQKSAPEARLRQNIQCLEMLQRNVKYRLSQDSGLFGQHGFFSPRHIIDQLASMANKPFIDETASLIQRAISHDAESQAITRAQEELKSKLTSSIKEKKDRGQRIYLRETTLKHLKEAVDQQKLALFAVSNERQSIEDQTKARAETISEVLRLEKAVRLGAQWEFPKRSEVQWSLWNPLSYGKKIMRDTAWCCKSIAQWWHGKPIEQAIEDEKTKSDNQLVKLEAGATIDPPVLTNEFASNFLSAHMRKKRQDRTAQRAHARIIEQQVPQRAQARINTPAVRNNQGRFANWFSQQNTHRNGRQQRRAELPRRNRRPRRAEREVPLRAAAQLASPSQAIVPAGAFRPCLTGELNISKEQQPHPSESLVPQPAPAAARSALARQQRDRLVALNPIDAANFARQRRQLRSFASDSSDQLYLD